MAKPLGITRALRNFPREILPHPFTIEDVKTAFNKQGKDVGYRQIYKALLTLSSDGDILREGVPGTFRYKFSDRKENDVSRIRGVLKAVADLRNELPNTFTYRDVNKLLQKDGWDLTPTQIRNPLNAMARDGRLIRTGNKDDYIYRFAPRPVATVTLPLRIEEDPLQLLLDAMAQAEPIIRRMIKAREFFRDEGET